MVRAQELALSRGGQTLFEGIELEIAKGGICGVTGPSGCGKSSMGDVLLGLIAPTRGRVTWAETVGPFAIQKLYQDPVAAFPRKRRIGEAINDLLRLTGHGRDAVDGLMERLGLVPDLLARRPDAVSGGELQRLSLLRVLLRQPAFLFADEPTSRLDPITQARVITLLRETAERDAVAIMLVSHDPALIAKTADTIVPLGTAPTPDHAASGLQNTQSVSTTKLGGMKP